jgi:hypothetical protein
MWKRLWNLLMRRKKASPAVRVDRFKFYDRVKELDSILDDPKGNSGTVFVWPLSVCSPKMMKCQEFNALGDRYLGANLPGGDLNDNGLKELTPADTNPEPTRIEDGVVIFPGGVIFDPVEFRQFQKDHPPSYTVKTHEPVNGVGVVGISPRGVVDPGLVKGILDELTKKDCE